MDRNKRYERNSYDRYRDYPPHNNHRGNHDRPFAEERSSSYRDSRYNKNNDRRYSDRRDERGRRESVHSEYEDKRRRSDAERRENNNRSDLPQIELSKVQPISKWPRKLKNWDVPPPGFEHMTAMQVKLTGLFPLPGHEMRDPSIVGMPSLLSSGMLTGITKGAQQHKEVRRVYAGNLPNGVSEEEVKGFFNKMVSEISGTSGKCVTSVSLQKEKNFAYVDFRSIEDANLAMSFDGMAFDDNPEYPLKIRRPKGYVPLEGDAAAAVVDSEFKIFVGGIPGHLRDDQIKELLEAFGELRTFSMTKGAAIDKCFVFCEYLNTDVTDIACSGLNGMDIGSNCKLVVMKANTGKNLLGEYIKIPGASLLQSMLIGEKDCGDANSSNVLQFLNALTLDDLDEEDEYKEIYQDLKEEFEKYGVVKRLEIPKADEKYAGKVFVTFASNEEAGNALDSLNGRKFSNRIIIGSYCVPNY
jgi:splicing factor U2AF subunit